MNHANRPPVGALATARNRILTASTLGLAVLLGALLVWNSSSERLAHAHWIEAQAAQAARAVSAYGALLQAQAQTLAAHGNPDTAQITFPTLESSQFVPLGGLGIADPSFDSGLLRNNIETRLVGRAFNGEAVRAEAYRDGERWIVIAAARLSADRPDARGVLLLRTDLGMAAREHLALHSDAGTFSLWAHGAEDHYRFVAQPGAGDAPPEAPRYLAETDVRPIYAGFDPTSSLPSRAVFAGAIMLSAGLAAMLGLGALVLTAFRRLGSTLGADANRLRDL
ncbi:MAG: hypothetical protein KDI23_11140, partial [Pseudomonadales bacterium]|nr:hypothetical protein [Pseudomonadales bacterium]